MTTDPNTDLRQRIAEALYVHDHPIHVVPLNETGMGPAYRESADAVLAVLPPPADRAAVLREADWIEEHCPDHGCVEPETDGCHCEIAKRLRRQADEAPLSPYYEHPECGFHWHGRDGMDIPMQDGQPVCPRCELAKVQKKLDYTQRRRDELGAECKRRGKIKLEQAERITRLERQLDDVQAQLGAEILRAGQAEATLERIQRVIRRLANHAVGFQDMLDDSDRDPWAKTVGADIAELRRLADEPQPEPPVHGESVAHLAGDHDTEPAVDARQPDVQVWPLNRILTEVRCGSQDWPWEEEWADLDRRHAETGYLVTLEQQIRENGITMPVLIGSDGRLWDGHHRLRIAVRVGIPYVPVEIVSPTEPAVEVRQDGAQQDTESPRTICVCGHTRGEHLTVSGRLLCDTCDPDSTDNLVCRGFDAL